MDRKKIILILGAAWLSAALLTWFLYAATKAPRIEKTTSVVAAARDIPAGTLLRKEDLTTIAVRDREIPGHAILDPKLAISRALLLPVSAYEPITAPKLGATGIEGLPAIIDIGMRAVTVPITDASGVAGLIPPRAHVDVLFTRPGNASEALTSTILEDVVVLAMGRVTEVTPTDTSKPAASSTATQNPARAQTATLLVTPDQVRRIELAKNLGKISLSLRNPLDNTDTGEETTTTPEDLGMTVPPPPVRTVVQRPIEQPRYTPPAPTIVPKVLPPKPKTVEAFRGSTHVQEAIK